MSVTSGRPNTVIIVTPQNVFSHTNPTTQPGDNNEPLPSTEGSGVTMHPPFGVGVNRGQQIPQLVMWSPLPLDLVKKSQASNTQAHYTSNVAKTGEFLVKEKFITFPQDHQLPNKEELRGKFYYKYHNSWNHITNSCWSFKNIIQDRVNKRVLKFLGDNKVMVKFP